MTAKKLAAIGRPLLGRVVGGGLWDWFGLIGAVACSGPPIAVGGPEHDRAAARWSVLVQPGGWPGAGEAGVADGVAGGAQSAAPV